MNSPLITTNDLTIGYKLGKHKEKKVHQHLSFSLRRGELTCLLGPNGAGKSTLLRTMAGSQKPLAGQLDINGHPVSSLSKKELSRQIGLVLTDRTMSGGLTVSDLVSLGRHPHTGFFGHLTPHDHDVIRQSLDSVGITHKSESYVAELSDGERQKVMIAKALAQECPILLLDEPTAFLDVVSRIEIMKLLHDLAAQKGKTILLSTHDLEQALLLGDRLWLLSKESGLHCGTTEDLIFSGEVDRYFSRNEIHFDRSNGSFRPNHPGGIPVFPEASGELLLWTKNILLRHGFQVAENREETPFLIRTDAPDHLLCYNAGKLDHELNSFEALSDYLNILKKDQISLKTDKKFKVPCHPNNEGTLN